MDELAERFARADPARTTAGAPVTPDAEARLKQIISTPRDHGTPHHDSTRRWSWNWRKPVLLLAGAGTIALLVSLVGIIGLWGPRPPAPPTDEIPAPTAADYPWYTDEQELTDAADAIVRGSILDQHDSQVDGLEYTVVTVQIASVAKGPLRPGERIDVKYLEATAPVPVGLGLNDDAVLFLVLFSPDPASLVNPKQGSFLVVDGSQLQASDENHIRLSDALRAQLGVVN